MFSRYFAASCGRGLLLLSLAAVCSLALVAGDASEGAEGSTSISLPASTRPSGNGRDSSHGTTVEYKLATLNVRLAKPLKQNPLPPLNYSWEPAWRYRRCVDAALALSIRLRQPFITYISLGSRLIP